MNDDFCAQRMRDIANQSKRELENKEFQEVVDKITNAARGGATKVWLTFSYDTTKSALEYLGFKIKKVDYITNYTGSSESCPTYYEVNWGGE